MQAANLLTGEAAGAVQFTIPAHARRQPVWALLRRACEEAAAADWVER
jgi:hypothetical protein